MRLRIWTVLFVLFSVLCFAQIPLSDGPQGRMDPCPTPPSIYPFYDPPNMKLIPAGEFQMGDHHGEGYMDEYPVHTVFINAFYMDANEVTALEYSVFLNSAYSQGLIELHNGIVKKKDDIENYCHTTLVSYANRITWDGSTFGVTAGKEDHPMVSVSWYGAVAYANWLSGQHGYVPCYDLETWECTFGAGGYRLPTEAEWEKAARGGEYSPYYRYPWGDDIDGTKANYWDSGDPYENGNYPKTTPVGYYDGNQVINGIPQGEDMANGYGLYDMAGSMLEWCNDRYGEFYYHQSPTNNPRGPTTGSARVVRGGVWEHIVMGLRCAIRLDSYQGNMSNSSGFRLVFD